MVRKLVCSLLIVASVITAMPIGVSAEWKHDTSGWWYKEGNSYSTGWRQIDGTWYYFVKDGYMKRGWIQDGKWWYYLQDDGAMATGEISIKGKSYEFDSSGRWIYSSTYNVTSTTNISKPPSVDKLKLTTKFSWFYENGNTYFKIKNDDYLKGAWNINGWRYVFDSNGVLQKGEYTASNGKKYLLASDGRFIKCTNDKNFELYTGCAIATKSTSDNSVVKLDDSHMLDITKVYTENESVAEAITKSITSASNTTQSDVRVEGKTLYCKTNQAIRLGDIKVIGTDSESTSFPSLAVTSQRTNEDVAFLTVNLSLEDGFLRNVQTGIFTHKPGKTTVTIDVNGTKTSFDVVVTE